jgi:RND superfamily putative drug exporter
VSRYAINIVTLIGLGVSIDYSLFTSTVPRRAAAGAAEDAIATTMATAGRAITFSGFTVAVGLSACFSSGHVHGVMGAAARSSSRSPSSTR